jgi:hypothetical protein
MVGVLQRGVEEREKREKTLLHTMRTRMTVM